MPRRDPREARALGLWTAGWLFALLLAGLVWIGDLAVQWPVLTVPLVWALVALRPRGGRSHGRRRDDEWPPDDDLAGWPPPDDVPPRMPPTRELPWLPDVPRDRRQE
ncbi:hypothetical protein SAMN05660657_02427 [Geodermatophilus amargosae]|uniref:Uncharacterized protein n=1 Tax=Geodermatophilus amargosae TaxID=1296565 RepID=A0A1I7A252_9ACTN|nr:hypothetical protein [Geodermatophilus amargosae]SFT69018.1 hypothetical protein SAMN05660657_02427 [Geodermatophilus amargosae]